MAKKTREVSLRELAKVIRSKNAGPFLLTLDVLMANGETFEKVKDSGAINPQTISQLYGIPPDKIQIFFYPAGLAVKITIPRPVASGDIEDRDVYGAQQHTPLLDLKIPIVGSN